MSRRLCQLCDGVVAIVVMVSLPSLMRGRLAVVGDDGNDATGDEVNDHDGNGATGVD